MSRYGSWVANAALFVLSSFLLADLSNALIGELLTPDAAALATPDGAAAQLARPRRDRGVILSRNLFNVSTLAPPKVAVSTEELEATALPLRLLGTASADDVSLARAAVEDQDTGEHLVVRVHDRLRNQVTVARIERGRIVLQNGDRLEELTLGGAEGVPKRSLARSRARPRRRPTTSPRSVSDRVRNLGRDRFAVSRSDVEAVSRNPSTLFSQARFLPKYQDGSMVGIEFKSVKSGSIYEEVGIQPGDVITELNGIRIDSQEQMSRLIGEFAGASSFEVEVMDKSGATRSLSFTIPD